MKYYKVKIISKGKAQYELFKAESKLKAIAMAEKKHPRSVVVKAEITSAPIEDTISDFFKGLKKTTKKKIPINDKIATIRQIAVMTNAGIPINDSLENISKSIKSPVLKEVYTDINNGINSGNSLSDSIKPYAEEFGAVTLAMTELGERTGNLSEAYHKLSNILENIRDNKAKFKKAIRGPIITLIAMAIAFTILIMVVVPKFKTIFEKFDADLPIPTLILLWLENALTNYGIYILVGIFSIIYMIIHFYKTSPEFKYKMDGVLINKKFYLINKAIFLSTMHKYNLVFGELVKSGIPVAEALNTAVGMVENEVIKEKLLEVNQDIGRGMSLADAFEKTNLYEDMLLQMIKAGETGGQLDAMLDKVTDYYDMEFQDLIDNLSSYIEPIMLFFIAGLVLLMALGIFMPMWGLGSAVNH